MESYSVDLNISEMKFIQKLWSDFILKISRVYELFIKGKDEGPETLGEQ